MDSICQLKQLLILLIWSQSSWAFVHNQAMWKKISSSEWDHWHLLLHIIFNLKTPSKAKIRPSKMQKWRNVGAVCAASIALYCCHSGALFSTTVICPQETLRIIQGKEKKNFLRRATPNAATPTPSGRFGSSTMQAWKGDKWERYWSGQECLLVSDIQRLTWTLW